MQIRPKRRPPILEVPPVGGPMRTNRFWLWTNKCQLRSWCLQIRPKRRPPISEVLLVGGATRMPSFSRFITNATGLRPRPAAVDPDEV